MVGKIGRVTGKIAPGVIGEVMVPVRGGTEAFHAYATEGDDDALALIARVREAGGARIVDASFSRALPPIGSVTDTGEDELQTGTRIVVVEYFPPRTVIVTKM